MSTDLIRDTEIFTESIRSKLLEFYGERRPRAFFDCGSHAGTLTCQNCDDCKVLTSHCSRKWCPRCQHRVIKERVRLIRLWSRFTPQPKFVTLTARNSSDVCKRVVRRFQKALTALRRQKVFREVTGGCQSIEVTNESRGWHVHAHLIVNARWIDAGQLAIAFGKLVGQDYAIVKVKDARDHEYAAEVAKYVCKPNDLARWQPNEVAEFIHAVTGVRMFQPFGDLMSHSREIRAILASEKRPTVCDCGCERWKYDPTFYAQPSRNHTGSSSAGSRGSQRHAQPAQLLPV